MKNPVAGPPVIWKGPYCCRVVESEQYIPDTPPTNPPANNAYNRWIYRLTVATWQSQANYLEFGSESMIEGVNEFKNCLNLAELNNTHLEIMGVQRSQIPSGFTLDPIDNGSFVMAWIAPAASDDNDIENLCVFYAMNQYSGTCT